MAALLDPDNARPAARGAHCKALRNIVDDTNVSVKGCEGSSDRVLY